MLAAYATSARVLVGRCGLCARRWSGHTRVAALRAFHGAKSRKADELEHAADTPPDPAVCVRVCSTDCMLTLQRTCDEQRGSFAVVKVGTCLKTGTPASCRPERWKVV